MNGLHLILLFIILILALKLSKTKDQLSIYEGKKEKIYVPNFEELMRERDYKNFKRRIDYVFLSGVSFVNWALMRAKQVYRLIKERG
jgi:uncharacterized protein YehS (DUF1456 family)